MHCWRLFCCDSFLWVGSDFLAMQISDNFWSFFPLSHQSYIWNIIIVLQTLMWNCNPYSIVLAFFPYVITMWRKACTSPICEHRLTHSPNYCSCICNRMLLYYHLVLKGLCGHPGIVNVVLMPMGLDIPLYAVFMDCSFWKCFLCFYLLETRLYKKWHCIMLSKSVMWILQLIFIYPMTWKILRPDFHLLSCVRHIFHFHFR